MTGLPGYLRAHPGMAFAYAVVAVLLFLAVLGPYIGTHDPQEADARSRLEAPSGEHWFGTDSAGLDVFSRVIAAPRIDLTIALLGVVLSLAIGVTLGLISGYFSTGIGGAVSQLILRVTDMVQSFPVFVLAMALVAYSGQNIHNVVFAIAFVNAPFYLRLVHARVRGLRQRGFVEFSQVAGVRGWRIMLRHLLPNSITPVLVQVSINVGWAILLTAGLSFVGAGVRAPTPEWGLMISQGAETVITGQWWPALFPGLALALAVFALALVGQSMEDLLDPQHRSLPAGAGVLDARAITAVTGREVSGEAGPSAVQADVTAAEGVRDVVQPPPPVADRGVSARNDRPAIDHSRVLVGVEDLEVIVSTSAGVRRAVAGASLAIRPAETVAIVGESGAGKTTVANAILQQLRPGATMVGGRISFDHGAYDSSHPGRWKELRGSRIGYVVSNPASHLDPVRRIGDQVADVYRLHAKLGRNAARREAVAALAQLGIPDPDRLARAYPHQISGGMAQRVVIASALAGAPDLLIADEPVSGLDVTLQRQILDEIVSRAKQHGSALLFVTHDLGLAGAYCERVVVMQDGMIIEEAETGVFFDQPRHPYSRQLISAASGGREVTDARPA